MPPSCDGWANATRRWTWRRAWSAPLGAQGSTTSASTCCTTFRLRPPIHGASASSQRFNSGPDHISAYALSLDDPDAEGLTSIGGDHLPLRRGARRWRTRARLEQDDEGRPTSTRWPTRRCSRRPGVVRAVELVTARPGEPPQPRLLAGRRLGSGRAGAHAFDGARPGAGTRPDWTPTWPRCGRAMNGRTAATRRYRDNRRRDGHLRACDHAPQDQGRPAGRVSRIGLNSLQLSAGRKQTSSSSKLPTDRCRLTLRGRLLSNEVFTRLLPRPRHAPRSRLASRSPVR